MLNEMKPAVGGKSIVCNKTCAAAATLVLMLTAVMTPCYAQPLASTTTVASLVVSTTPAKTNIEKLGDLNADVRKEAVIFLGMEKNRKNLPHLLKMLKDRNGEVRRAAVNACVITGTPQETGPAILEMLKKENEVGPINTAIEALGGMKYASALPEIKKQLSHSYPTIRSYSVKALSEFNDRETYPLIVEKLLDPAEGVRFEAMKAAVRMKIKSAGPNLIENLKNPIASIKREAANSLGEIGSSAALPELEKLKDAKDVSVRIAVQQAIEKINKRGAGK